MDIKKVKGRNDYTWRGLTLGKLIAIKESLKRLENITPVENDILIFLKNQDLDNQDPFA